MVAGRLTIQESHRTTIRARVPGTLGRGRSLPATRRSGGPVSGRHVAGGYWLAAASQSGLRGYAAALARSACCGLATSRSSNWRPRGHRVAAPHGSAGPTGPQAPGVDYDFFLREVQHARHLRQTLVLPPTPLRQGGRRLVQGRELVRLDHSQAAAVCLANLSHPGGLLLFCALDSFLDPLLYRSTKPNAMPLLALITTRMPTRTSTWNGLVTITTLPPDPRSGRARPRARQFVSRRATHPSARVRG